MKKNRATWIFVGLGVLILGGLFVYPKFRSGTSLSGGTDVKCLVPQLQLYQHIHPRLTILVDNKSETIPANIGIGACMRELHTHDATGELHVESHQPKDFKLKDFLEFWGKPIERAGYKLEVSVDGQPVLQPAEIVLKDNQQIIMKYTKVAQ